jgi:hypothetical protein
MVVETYPDKDLPEEITRLGVVHIVAVPVAAALGDKERITRQLMAAVPGVLGLISLLPEQM